MQVFLVVVAVFFMGGRGGGFFDDGCVDGWIECVSSQEHHGGRMDGVENNGLLC